MKTHMLVELHKIKVAALKIGSLQNAERMSNLRREGRNEGHNSYSGHLCVTHGCSMTCELSCTLGCPDNQPRILSMEAGVEKSCNYEALCLMMTATLFVSLSARIMGHLLPLPLTVGEGWFFFFMPPYNFFFTFTGQLSLNLTLPPKP